MALPKVQYPLFNVDTIDGKQLHMRPMLVKEERILLIAKQSGERIDQLNAIKQVVNNCVQDKGFDIDKIAFTDLEYLFLQLRKISISDKVKVSFVDNQDNKQRDFDIDLNTVGVDRSNSKDNRITVGDSIIVTVRPPSVALMTSKAFFEQKDEDVERYMMINSIESIVDGDQMYSVKTSTKEELDEFWDSISAKDAEKISEYFAGLPRIGYSIKYTNDNGIERSINLKSLDDFFTF